MKTNKNYIYKNQLSNIVFFNKDQNNILTAYSLPQFIQSIPQASFSSIITLASFIVCKINTLVPPDFKNTTHKSKLKQQFPNQALSLSHLLQPWCDYIVNLVQTNQVYQADNKICFAGEANQTFLQELQQNDLFEKINFNYLETKHFNQIQQSLSKQLCKKIINPMIQIKKQKTAIGLMWTSKLTLQQDIYHPKIHFPALIQGMLYQQGFQMMHFKIPKGHYPTAQQFMRFDIVIISGSSFSINQNIPQIQHFCKMLKQFYIKNKKLKILGLCFGHQAIAKYFGGKVQQIQKRITGLQKVYFKQAQIQNLKLSFLNFAKQGGQYLTKNQLQLYQYHIDQVSTIPQQFLIIAESSTCSNQIMISKDTRILSFQFHMEYCPQYVRSYQIRIQSYKPNQSDYVLQKSGVQKKAGSQGTQVSFLSLLQMRRICGNFINCLDFNQ